MKYLCSKCSNQLTKFEIELNELYPVGKLYCETCQKKHEKEISAAKKEIYKVKKKQKANKKKLAKLNKKLKKYQNQLLMI